MESFVLKVDESTYKVIKSAANRATFSVFNHSSFHTITKISKDQWQIIEHRFGNDNLPLQEIGRCIEAFYSL